MRLVAALCLVVGCGSSGGNRQVNEPEDPARVAARKRDKEIEAMKPPSPYEVREMQTFRPTEQCGQGPYRFETDSLKAKYSEKLYVYACGKHVIKGNYRMTTTRKTSTKPSSDESAFGFTADNEACKGREVAVRTVAGGGGGGGPVGKGGGTTGGVATAAAPATIKPLTLEPAAGIPTDCERTQVINMSWISGEDGVPIDGHIVLDVWSDEPMDLAGLVFVVEKSGVRADMTRDGWKAYLAADRAHHEAYMANLDIEVKAGRTTLVDSRVKTPPPPPPRVEIQSPRPSVHARWIPGYWFFEDTKFHWIAGLWDVPEEDLQKQLTVQAPTPPPVQAPVRDEPVEPQPTRTAVWTPGSWQWDGRAYIWVQGAWRIPPDPQHTWQRPTWNVSAGRAVFVPGGWRIGVRFGR